MFRCGVLGRAFDICLERRDRACEHLFWGALKQATPDHAIKEHRFIVILGKAVHIAAGLSCRANVPEHLAASGSLTDSSEYLCNQLPCVSERIVDSTFVIFIPGQCGFPQNRNAETAVDRFELSRRGSR